MHDEDDGVEYPGSPRGDTWWITARIEHRTPKAILVELFSGSQVWLPLSQVSEIHPPNEDGERRICISHWIAEKNGITL